MGHRMSDEFAATDDTGSLSQQVAAFTDHFESSLDGFEERLLASFRHDLRVQTRIFVLSMVALGAIMGPILFVGISSS